MSVFAQKFANNAELTELCKKEGITYLALFGSYARDEMDKSSDIDLLYRLKKGVTYFQFFDLVEKLKLIFGKEVDAVSVNHVRDSFYKVINSDIEVLYEE